MNRVIDQMLQGYDLTTIYDKKNAMKEIMQEIVLCGLSRAGFFKQAAFYGGTALRIFYGLDRFSEDLDFSLMEKNTDFNLKTFFPLLEKEVQAYGLNVTIQEKEKTQDSFIRSAFLKANTQEHLLLFYQDSDMENISKSELIKIKFEVDVNPPRFAAFERKYQLLPGPYEINLYDGPSLFAGKVHAVICRAWKNRVKGRDLYDYVFYLSRGIALNTAHLRERLIESGYITATEPCSLEDIKKMLCNRFKTIDYEQAKNDVIPFIKDTAPISLWCEDFFKQITEELKEM